MGLSALTVKSHLARIARKLGTGDRAGMVAVALRTGIIHIHPLSRDPVPASRSAPLPAPPSHREPDLSLT